MHATLTCNEEVLAGFGGINNGLLLCRQLQWRVGRQSRVAIQAADSRSRKRRNRPLIWMATGVYQAYVNWNRAVAGCRRNCGLIEQRKETR